MRLRVVFRGMIWHHFDRDRDGSSRQNRGMLAARLINDPAHAHHGTHNHQPFMAFIARDGQGNALLGQPFSIQGKTIELQLQKTGGVTTDASFTNGVPYLREVYGPVKGARQAVQGLIAATVKVPEGMMRAGRPVTWTLRHEDLTQAREVPVKMGFFWNPGWAPRALATECILEADDLSQVSLDIRPNAGGLPTVLQPLNDPRFQYLAAQDTVEILVTSLPAARRGRLPWGVHYQLLFKAAGFTGGPYHRDRFNALVNAAGSVNQGAWRRAWEDDYQAMNGGAAEGLPFPHLVDDSGAPLLPAPSAAAAHDPPADCYGGDE